MRDIYEIPSFSDAISTVGNRVLAESVTIWRKMNNSRWILAILAVQIWGQVASVPQHSVGSRIIGGHDASISTVPYLLSLHRRGICVCGATIISPRWGMTAKHCVRPGGPSGEDYHVRAGSENHSAGGSTHKLLKFYSYDSKFHDGKIPQTHDILLFKVETPFRFSDKVMPANLPLKGISPPESLRVSGWGWTSTAAHPQFAQTVEVNRIAWKDCLITRADTPTQLCYGQKGANSCNGDSGGPLADDNNTVYGIVSYGSFCGYPPVIYAKVSYYRQWIKNLANV